MATSPSSYDEAPPNVRAVRDLLEWARAERFAIARVKIGDVELELHDLAPGGGTAAPPTKGELADASRGLYAEFGGELLAAALAEQGAAEDDDGGGDDDR